MFVVKLNVYDLSGCRAHEEKKADGVWHTGLVVYNKEFYFADGICYDMPGLTPYGVPKRDADLGSTEIPEEIFLSMLEDIAPRFSMKNYNMRENNGNHFTNECALLLTG